MKKMKFKLLTILILFSFISCSNILQETESKSDSNTYVMISSGNVSVRTISPTEEYALKNLDDVWFYATKKTKNAEGNYVYGTKKTLAGTTSTPRLTLAGLYNKQFVLEGGAGEYDFELRGYLDGIYFYKKIEAEILESKTNLLTFELEPAKGYNELTTPYEDFGGLSIKLNFNTTDVSRICVKLEHLGTNETIEDTYFTSFNSGKWTYKHSASSTTGSESRIPIGQYRVTFDFKKNDTVLGDFILINSYSYIVNVLKGRNSYYEEDIDLNQVYTITYTDNGGSLVSGEKKQSKFTHNDEVKLPVLKKDGLSFRGWYTTSNYIKGQDAEGKDIPSGPVTKIEKGTTENVSLYAKWDTTKIWVDASNGNDSTGDGTDEHRLKTIEGATKEIIKRIKDGAAEDLDWFIYMYGTFNFDNTQIIKDAYDGVDGDLFCNSLTIMGGNGLSSGEPRDILQGNGASPVISIPSIRHIIFRNIKIIGGTTCIVTGLEGEDTYQLSEVTLGSGTHITGNTAGGVIVNGGYLEVLDGAVIDNNTSSSTGAGIKVTNEDQENDKNLYIRGGTINNNTKDSNASDICTGGRTNIYISGSPTIGALTICRDEGSTYESEITDSPTIDSLIFEEEELHVSGSPKITYCKINSDSKIYLSDSPEIEELKLESYELIVLEDNLSAGASITITPAEYTAPSFDPDYHEFYKTSLIDPYSSVSISNNYTYFQVTPEHDENGNIISSEWFIDNEGCLNYNCTITFENLGTGSMDPITIPCKIFEPGDIDDPEQEGYIFNGWYYKKETGSDYYTMEPIDLKEDYYDDEENLIEDYEFTAIVEDMTLYATWINDSGNIYINPDTGIDVISISSTGEDNSIAFADGSNASPLKTVSTALNYIKKINDNTKDYIVTINGTIVDYNISLDDSLPINSITLQGDTTGCISAPSSYREDLASILLVSTSAPVILKNIKIYEQFYPPKNPINGALINIKNGATVTLDDGTVIEGSRGIGATVGNNRSIYGAIAIEDGGKLVMEDNATIHKFQIQNGAVYVMEGGKFTMNGGTITDIFTDYSGGAVYIEGGSKSVTGGNFELNGGSVTGNQTNAIYNTSITTHLNGAGVCVVSGTFVMNGGEITNNQANASSASWSTAAGGGVYVYPEGSFVMNDGLISGNKAVTTYTEYTYANGEYTSEVKPGENASAYGGGVCLEASGNKIASFTMNGGTISGNTADTAGNGIYFRGTPDEGTTGTITFSKDALITPDNNVYLPSYITIKIANALTGDSENPIKATITPQNYETGTQILEATNNVSLENEYDFFAITPQIVEGVTTNWFIDAEGKLYKHQVGDLLLKDGSYVFYDETYQFSEEDATNAVGIIYDLNEEGKPRGILGLKNSWGQWAPDGSTGFTTKFEDIICTPIVDGDNVSFSGDTDGSDNWDYICHIDPEGSASPATNYPVFNYALNYADTAGLIDSNYKEGWYIPSAAEIYYINKNLTTINSVLTKVKNISSSSANTLASTYFWTSSQADSGEVGNDAWYINISATSNPFTSSRKDWDSPGVCCIHLIEE